MKPAKNKYQLDPAIKPLVFDLIRNHKNEEVIAHFDQHPEELTLKGWMSDTPLHIASQSGNYTIADYLLKNGAHVNAQRTGVFATPLCWADNESIAKLLLDNGATMNDLELDKATRGDKIKVIDLLLERGAEISKREPQYLHCTSIAAIKVYLKHGVEINDGDENGNNLLHKLTWLDLPDELDFALSNGVPWKKDNSRRNPFYLARQGKRDKVFNHLSNHYPDLISNKIISLDVDLDFEKITCISKAPNTIANYIALTENGKLINYKAKDTDALVVTKAVEIDVPLIRNFTINASNDLIIPTGSNQLQRLNSTTFELQEIIIIDANLALDQITYLPRQKVYIGSSSKWEIFILNENFEVLNKTNAEDGTFYPLINEKENLISFWSYDQVTYFNLYRLEPDFQVNFIHSFYETRDSTSSSFAFLGESLFVAFPNKIEAYRLEGDQLIKTQELNIEDYYSPYDICSLITRSDDLILFGKGDQLIVYQKRDRLYKVEEMSLPLNAPIRQLYCDNESSNLLVITDAEIRLVDLNGKSWG